MSRPRSTFLAAIYRPQRSDSSKAPPRAIASHPHNRLSAGNLTAPSFGIVREEVAQTVHLNQCLQQSREHSVLGSGSFSFEGVM